MTDPYKILPSTPLKPRKRAIVIGATGGIGAALARILAAQGFSMALVDRELTALQVLCAEINNQAGETAALPYAQDVT